MDAFAAITRMKLTLSNVTRWLDKAEAHGQARAFDPGTLLVARLAPDQYPLIRQIQSACDSAKFAAARLSGKEAPRNPDTETTLAEIRARIDATVAYLETFSESDFAGAEKRVVPLSFMPGKGLRAKDYLWEMSVPNFFFHVSHAYAILRHNGVDVGKADFVAPMTILDL